MTYTPHAAWAPGNTVFAADLNNWEQGISAVSTQLGLSISAQTQGFLPSNSASANDTAMTAILALAASTGFPVHIEAGSYSIATALAWNVAGLTVYGDGPGKTSITQTTANTQVAIVGGTAQTIEGMTLRYATQEAAANTTSSCMEFRKGFNSTYRNLNLKLGARAIYLAQLDAGGGTNVMFSCTFDTILISGFSISSIDISSYPAGSSASTGSTWSNIYIQNNFPGTVQTSSSAVVVFQYVTESVFNQFNVEWCEITVANHLMSFYQCRNLVFNGLHVEGAKMSNTASTQALFSVRDSNVMIDGLALISVTYAASSTKPVFRMLEGSIVRVHGLETNSATVNATDHPLVYYVAVPTSGGATITGARTVSEFTALVFGDSSPGRSLVSTAAGAINASNQIATGEATNDRMFINSSTATQSTGIFRVVYFTATKTETITSLSTSTTTTAAAATPTLARFGVYSIDSAGAATLVASTANDTTLFATAFTKYTKALSSSWAKVAGQRYAIGILVVTAAAAPTIAAASLTGNVAVFSAAPRISGQLASQADLPSTYTDVSLTGTGFVNYVEMVP